MTRKKKTISQQRIARDLGVSQALVSLVLNGKRENISEESYQKIWNHALKMGYRPKGMRIATGQSQATNVGFILRAGLQLHTQSIFFSHVQHGLHAGLLARGFQSVFLGSEDDLGAEAVQQVLRERELAGVAVLGQVGQAYVNAIRAVQPNVVAISFCCPGLCHSVMPNERQAVEQLVDHLASLGHRDFAWIGGDRGLDYNQRRKHALVEALGARGLKLNRRFCVEMDTGDRLAGWKAGKLLLKNVSARHHPTASVCANGSMARGFLNCLMQEGWRIPERMSVVAVDATRLCVEEHPQITGAHADPEKIGTTAVELLLRNLERTDGVLTDAVLPSQLAVRETSGEVPG